MLSSSIYFRREPPRISKTGFIGWKYFSVISIKTIKKIQNSQFKRLFINLSSILLIQHQKCAPTFITLHHGISRLITNILRCWWWWWESQFFLWPVGGNDYVTTHTNTKSGERAFCVSGPAHWRSLPETICATTDPRLFKKNLNTHYFNCLLLQ